MAEMIHLALRSEYTFKDTFQHIGKLADYGDIAVGIADRNNTYGHIAHWKKCKEKGIKAILGVRIMVCIRQPEDEKRKKLWGPEYIFIAKNDNGLKEIYHLVQMCYDNFYYHPFIFFDEMIKVSKNVFVIAETFEDPKRLDYIALTQSTLPMMLDWNIPKVFICNNRWPEPKDKKVYELLAGPKRNMQTYPQHVLSLEEMYRMWPGNVDAWMNTMQIAKECNANPKIADTLRYNGKSTLEEECRVGAIRNNIDMTDPIYKARYEMELKLIDEKGFRDYFLITSELISKAKKTMLVGPARGSSAGSLVCYLMGITEVNPIVHGLIFERFIDANRNDLPDIDVDFPDYKRDEVIEDLIQTNGREKVRHISTISRLKPKSAIGDFAKNLNISSYETDEIKNAIIDRSGGDARAAMKIVDTFDTTEAGQRFIKKFPAMKLVVDIENHARHPGVHAAGIIVANDELWNYGGINTRDDVIMIDKKEASHLNLLKIDCLGLRTLSVLEECANLIGMDYHDYYSLPLDDEATFKLLDDMRLSGIFQFEGRAMKILTREMGIENFNDIVAITALARPGPLHSGGANLFIKRRIGEQPLKYLSDHPDLIKHTKDTHGVIIYQEQLMTIARDFGDMSWNDVQAIRRAASKSMGEEFFNKYKDVFLEGTRKKKVPDKEAIKVWENMVTFGSWGMNKSHTVSYGMISYWTAYMKTHHILEFVVANLNHSKNVLSSIKILRDALEYEGIEHIPVDPDESRINWRVHNGKILGGLTNIPGIGITKAKKILKARAGKAKYTPSIVKSLLDPKTAFDTLYPCKHFWQDIYDDHKKYKLIQAPIPIEQIQIKGSYHLIGMVRDKDLLDLNEYNKVAKRGGKVMTGQTQYLKLNIEDDTDAISCTIGRFQFVELRGQFLSDTLVKDKSWVLIKGKINSDWRAINIEAIVILNEWQSDMYKERGGL